MKRVLFIGNRTGVWQEARIQPDLSIVLTLATENSFLQRDPALVGGPHGIVRNKAEMLAAIAGTEYDILLSNGCPYVLPVTQLRRPSQLFINVHPSLLPELRGKHPVNGALLLNHPVAGATMHYMDDGVDTGHIIAQRQIPLTADLDLGLLYRCLFRLEAEVFRAGLARLREHGFDFAGEHQHGAGSYYSRKEGDARADLATMPRAEFLRRVRSFGVPGQGVRCTLTDRTIIVFAAEAVDHPYVCDLFGAGVPGSVALDYDGKVLARGPDGLVKITHHQPASA